MKSFGLYMRENFNSGDEIRDAGLKTPEDVRRFDGIVYGPDSRWNVLDIYRPKSAEGKLPVIISFHGGGWVYGDKERYQFYCMNIARLGFAVVNFTYRLAPEFQHPAGLEDMNRVAGWVMTHAEEYGLDTANIFGIGDSAGANGIGLYAAILTNPDYAAVYEFSAPEGFAFRAVGLLCGTYRIDLPNYDDEVTMPLIAEYMPNGGTVPEMEAMNLFKHITGDFPAVFAATGTGDFLRVQLHQLVNALVSKDIPFCARYYVSGEKVLGHDFCCNIGLKEAHECVEDMCGFFRKYVKN
ncbi:MAG: alpha/beta hydrolase [Synergistaceae bacterium]|nr:alpha/beta hydrolase [Synergistaceae bacterium]